MITPAKINKIVKNNFIILLCLLPIFCLSQVSITNSTPSTIIDFSSSMQTSVGTNPSTPFEGDGFQPNPTTLGRLNSNAWDIKGFSFGMLGFGGTQTVDAFGRGMVATGVVTHGIYSYTDTPATVANPCLMVQPAAGEFAPGSITLRIRNNGTTNLTQLQVNYNLFVRNDENRSNSFNFSHSNDNLVFQNEPILDYASPDVADAFQWVQVGVSPSRSIIITGINVAPGGYYYVRWSSDDISGSGSRDEFGLDDIYILGTYGTPAPEINVTGYATTILNGDTTPSVSDGTDFAPSGSPVSTFSSNVIITYNIQNLGGATLNISNVTITGAHASDFTIFGTTHLGAISAVSGGVVSYRDLSIMFDPSAAGLRSAIVTITNDDATGGENPYVFYIQGYGIDPVPEIDLYGNTGGTNPILNNSLVPSALNNTLFAQQIVGVTNQTKDYRIRNNGTAFSQLFLTSPSPFITIGGANPSDFTLITFPTIGVINPGFSRTFSIRFSPTAPGIRNATVTIANNDSDENPYTFLIQGTGISPEIDITGNSQPIVSGSTIPTFVNHTFFDYLDITTATLDRTFTVKNNGTHTLAIGALTITGPAAGDYTIITTPAATLATGASTTFIIRFNPSAVGVRDAVINLVNDDINENPYVFSISGYGLDYVGCGFGTSQLLAIQDFESIPSTPTWTFTPSGAYSIATGSGYGASGDAGGSLKYIGGRSFQVNNGTGTIIMSNINTSTFSDVELNVRVGAFSNVSNNGLDLTDRVLVAVSANGGVTWSDEVQVTGRQNSVWDFIAGIDNATKIYTGANVVTSFGPVTAPSSSINYQTIEGISTISISNLPKVTNLSVRITVNNDAASEVWAIDNVALFGRRELTTTWDGASWDSGAPTSTVKAIINGNYSTLTNGNISSCKCQVNAGRTLTVNPNTSMLVQSNLDNAGTIIIESDGSLVQRNDFAVNTGSITSRRNSTGMVRYDYSYWSSPVSGFTLGTLSPASDRGYIYDTSIGNWSFAGASTIMVPGKGYIVRAPNSYTSTPTSYAAQFFGPTNNGFLQLPVVKTATNDWNLIGNPYPSALDADLFLGFSANLSLLGGTIYLWTHNTPITANIYTSNDYAAYNRVGGIGTRANNLGVNNSIPTGKIASGQSFFATSLANGNITFNNSMRVTSGNDQFFRNQENSSNSDGIEKNRIWLDLTNTQGAFKQTLIGYVEGATNGIDRDFDGTTINAGNIISFYSMSNEQVCAIQGRALPFDINDIVPLGFSSTIAGEFTISIEQMDGIFTSEQEVYLEDRVASTIVNIKEQPYDFVTEAGTFNDRFVLRYTDVSLGNPNFNYNNNVVVFSQEKNVEILSKENFINVTVYDILGREIFDKKDLNTDKLKISSITQNSQTLIVKIKFENGNQVTKKVIVN
jgi:hypothetical protein